MNIFTHTVCCDLCGGEGVGTARTAAAAWDARSVIRHSDPRECQAVLKEKARQQELREGVLRQRAKRLAANS